MKLNPLHLAVRLANQHMITQAVAVYGDKGGSQEPPRAPVESPDSLASIAYANILDLVSEGEIEGLVNGNQSIYLNETPIQGGDGTINFPGMEVSTRPGTQTQSYIQGFPSVENEVSVGFSLTTNNPYVKSFTNVQLSAVRVRISTPRMTEQNATTGDTTGSFVAYKIDLKVGNGNYSTVVNGSLRGKTTTLYERSHRINLPSTTEGWTIRIIRVTEDSSSGLISNLTNVVSYTEVIDAKFRYPNSALMGLKFDASQFSQIPTRAYHLKGIRVKVPVNYDPVLRTYTGVWNGTFKVAYTNNPAWIYYDILLNDRYGLGHMVKAFQVDRYELYRISQYCDQLVSDGKGGTEPRFTCNLYLQSRSDALKVLQDIAAIFRGMSYWGASQVFVTSDMPEDPTYTYTNANVIDGEFDYVGTGGKSRYSVCLVSWCDPNDFYRAKVEYVEDRDQMALFGHRQTEIAGIGCTSQAQAQRMGRWFLLTNKLETDTVTFSVSLDGTLVRPGKIVRVADNNRAGRRIGGRIRSATTTVLTLDAGVEIYIGDTITAIMPDGTAESRVIQGVGVPVSFDNTLVTMDQTEPTWDATSTSENALVVTVSPAFPDIPVAHSIWAIDSTTLATQQFRVLSVQEDFAGENMMYKVVATKRVTDKFDAVDTGTRIDSPPITVIPPSTQLPPSNIVLESDWSVSQGIVNTTMTVSWDPAPNAVAYEVQWRFNNGNWIYAGRTGTKSIQVVGILAGRYQARVQAFNSNGLGSVWGNSIEYTLDGKTTPPPTVSFLTTEELVFGIRVNWGFPVGVNADTTQRTEIWYGLTNVLENATKQGDYAYPQKSMTLMGLRTGAEFYFWARLVDRVGNVGAYYGPVYGQADQDASDILEYLSGQITETQLSQDLLAVIPAPGELDAIDSRIDNVIVVQNDDRSTFTSQINTATSTANNALAQTQTNASTIADMDGELAAMYTIKTQIAVDGKTYLAGIGVGVENNQGIIESQVLIAASRFAIIDPNVSSSTKYFPFVFQGGIAYIDTAFIQNLGVTTAKIGNLAVTTAKIANLAVDTAQINNLAVETAKINDLAVDTLKIAGRAVTIPLGYYGASAISAGGSTSGTYYDIATITYTATGFEVTVTMTAQYAAKRGEIGWRVMVDGSVFTSGVLGSNSTDNVFRDSFALTFMTTLSGASTVTLQMRPPLVADATNYGMTVSNRSMTILETKK